ncbi:MAG: GNAT family N-acetyltransferase [Spirochaetales bacterium]|nr:GNAT family N-acetyltransferase [Spirochaetales bacterium]
MSEVIFREIKKSDYPRIKELINEGFSIDKYISNTKVRQRCLNIYMQNCLIESSYSCVAEKDNKVIGIILGSAKGKVKYFSKIKLIFSALTNLLVLLLTPKVYKNILREFLKVLKSYNKLIHGSESQFQGSIDLFIVSKEARGLGIGKKLKENLEKYMTSENAKKIYLYTDNTCNYGFYDSQGFKRIGTNKIAMAINKEQLDIDVFLYSYEVGA